MTYVLDFRSSDTGGAVVPGRLVNGPGLGTLIDLRGETDIVFLVHGFNVNRPEGMRALLQLARTLGFAGRAFVAVLWPGDHWLRAISYPLEGKDADDTAAVLATFVLDTIAAGSTLSFASHSLGARVVMATIDRLPAGRYKTRQVCVTAAAVDDDCLGDERSYLRATAKVDRIAVLASRRDKVLRLAYPAGDLLMAFLFFRSDNPGLALGFHGPKARGSVTVPPNVIHEPIPDDRDCDHGHYLPGSAPSPQERANQASAADYIAQVIGGQPRPVYR